MSPLLKYALKNFTIPINFPLIEPQDTQEVLITIIHGAVEVSDASVSITDDFDRMTWHLIYLTNVFLLLSSVKRLALDS